MLQCRCACDEETTAGVCPPHSLGIAGHVASNGEGERHGDDGYRKKWQRNSDSKREGGSSKAAKSGALHLIERLLAAESATTRTHRQIL